MHCMGACQGACQDDGRLHVTVEPVAVLDLFPNGQLLLPQPRTSTHGQLLLAQPRTISASSIRGLLAQPRTATASSAGSEPKIQPRVSSVARPLPLLYPMWVLSVERLLRMEGPPRPHQELLKEGALVQVPRGSSMKVTFLSHQWVHDKHPDPEGRQLEALRDFISGLKAGKVLVSSNIEVLLNAKAPGSMSQEAFETMTNGFVWYDYFSVPQYIPEDPDVHEKQMAAIKSIPSYIQACEAFVVVCPTLTHRITGQTCDFNSWKSRGWCRIEQLVRLLTARQANSVLVMRSPSMAVYVSVWMHTLLQPVGEGAFTCDSDKELLGEVVHSVLKQVCQEADFKDELNYVGLLFKSLRAQLLRGLTHRAAVASPDPQQGLPSKEEQQDFLRNLGFKSWTDSRVHGWGPLTCAAVADDVGMINAAIAAGASLEEVVVTRVKWLDMPRGLSPLSLAAAFAGADAVEALLTARAQVDTTYADGPAPLCLAALRPSADGRSLPVLRALLNARASVNTSSSYVGMTPLHASSYSGSSILVEELLDKRASLSSRDMLGNTALHWLAQYAGTPELVALLVEHRASVNAKTKPRQPVLEACARAQAATQQNQAGEVLNFLADHVGSTPLHHAARAGNLDCCKALLGCRANPKLFNSAGHTAADLARAYDHVTIVELFVRKSFKTPSQDQLPLFNI